MIHVTAAVMRRADRYFVARRAPGRAGAGAWEFPGGKVQPGERPEAALRRELHEELGIDAVVGEHLHTTVAATGAPPLTLSFWSVPSFRGDIQLRDHDAEAWLTPAEMDPEVFAPADREFVARLRQVPSLRPIPRGSEGDEAGAT